MIRKSIILGICVSTIISISHCLESPSTNQPRLAERMCANYSGLVDLNATTNPSAKRVTLLGGGEWALPKEFPHMARIGFGPSNAIEWKCGGSIISRKYILTVAHCAKTRDGKEPTFVRIGDLIFDDETDDAQPETIEISDIIIYPSYNNRLKYNNIALLRLARDIQFNSYARPACLNTELSIPVNKAVVTGWNYQEWLGDGNKELSKLTLNLDANEDCTPHYESNRSLPKGISIDHICAGSKEGFNGYCVMEGGSPLQINDDKYIGMYKIVGILSFGKACGLQGIPEVYTRVSNYIDWIEAIAFSHG